MFGNPYLLGAVAVIAVGIVIFEFLSSRQTPHSHSERRRRRPPSPPPPRRPPSPPSKRRPSPSSKRRPPPSSNHKPSPFNPEPTTVESDENKVRKRNVDHPGKEREKKTPSNQGNELSKQDVYCKNMDKDNYEKNVYEKILKDITSVENISDEDSNSENNVSEIDTSELDIRNAVDSPVPSNDCNNLSQSKETEETYKKKVLDNMKMEDVSSQEVAGTSQNTNHSASVQPHEQNERIISNLMQDICSGCEENPLSAVANPCGHRYLCWECARRVFRIYRKCSICHLDIEQFEKI